VRPSEQQPGGRQYERRDESGYDAVPGAGFSPNTTEAYRPRANGGASAPSKTSSRSRRGQAPDYKNQGYLTADVREERRRPFGWVLWALLGLLAVGAVVALAFGLSWQGQYAGKVYAGVSVLGVDLGGKSQDAARKLINDKLEGFVSQPLTLTWRGKIWKPTAEQLGVKIDIDSAVNEAYAVGRGPDFFSNASRQWSASQIGYVVPLVVQISEPNMQAYLDGLAQNDINEQLSDGDVRLNGSEVVALPGKEGRNLRVYDAIAAMRNSVAKLEPATLDLPVDVVPPNVSADEVGSIQGLLAVRVSSPITATAPGGKQFTLDRDALVRFTTIERNPDRTSPKHIQLGWKDGELKILGARWAGESARPAQNARFAWNDGALAVLSESAEGFESDANAVVASIKEHADTPDKRQFDLPGKIITPTVSSKDIGALGIKDLMGTGTSTFKGSSAERATNIKVAAGLLNGAVVPPGGTFSFLETMGGIDEQHGFVEGYVIAAERTQRGVGGGVCQVSTTAFRAAFWSGVQVTERNQHSYRVGWYEANGEPVGFDAAVFDPGVDMKFANDTQHHILVEATVGGSTLTVNFYGTKPPGEIKLEGPAVSNRVPPPDDVYQVDTRLPAGAKKQVETAHAGLTTVIKRRIVVPGQPDKVDQFRSVYRPWPNWYIVASPNQVPGGAPVAPTPESTPTTAAPDQPAPEAPPTASP
jgi:vancomycin resistance protein YoaR